MATTPKCEPTRRGFAAALLAASFAPPARGAEDPLRLLRQPGAVGLMRHARAPGTGDPPGMRLGDCSTQRNLSGEGRAQARLLGQRLRTAGLDAAQVYSSAWCRARETAELLGFGPVSHLPLLDSFFEDRRVAAERTAALRAFLDAGRDSPPCILVSHQVNITALVGIFPADAELMVLLPKANGYQLIARVSQD